MARSTEPTGAPPPADPGAPAAVRVRGLVKRYGDLTAVDGIDLDIAPGETFGFLGPNGAGKSTTIKILCTLVHPTDGVAEVAGFDVVTDRSEVRRHIGLVFQDTTLDAYLERGAEPAVPRRAVRHAQGLPGPAAAPGAGDGRAVGAAR